MDNIERLGSEIEYLLSIYDEICDNLYTVEFNKYDIELFYFYNRLFNEYRWDIFNFSKPEIINNFINCYYELKSKPVEFNLRKNLKSIKIDIEFLYEQIIESKNKFSTYL